MQEDHRRTAILRRLSRMDSVPPAAAIPTGFRALDDALGGGLPPGQIVELFGPAGCGKTTLALQVAANLQRSRRTVAWLDADRTFDPSYATTLGVDVERMPVAQPDSAEQAFAIVRTLASSAAVD